MLSHRKFVVGVGGGIAAYKVCEIVSSLAKAGAEVRVVLTDRAEQFVAPLTFASLSRHRAYNDSDFWEAAEPRPLHIALGEWADLILLAPVTANTLAKLAHGLADNLLTNTVLASACPVLVAPAMNTDMWEQMTVQQNWQAIRSNPRYHTIGPGAGLLACDRVGTGRMAEPSQILAHLHSLADTLGKRDLENKQVLISAGSTREFLDPVRFIGNPATGKMGIALAQAAHHRGATVTLVHGPIEARLLAEADSAISFVPITTAAEMHQAMLCHTKTADWIIMAAAVADVRPASCSGAKLPKGDLPDSLPLQSVPDILQDLRTHLRSDQKLIGFAAQTGDIIAPALDKLKRKGLDLIVANPIDQPSSGFGSSTNQAVILTRHGDRTDIPLCSKLELAHRVLDQVRSL